MTNGRAEALFDCIVLGAGIAGVTAARDLQEAGLNVLLLEGSDRIGGRMYSVRNFVTKDGHPAPVEAGAEYVHVTEDRETGRYKEFWDELRRHGFSTAPLHKCGFGIIRIPRNRLFFPAWRRTKPLAEVVAVPELWTVPKCMNKLQDFDWKNKNDRSALDFAKRCVKDEKLSPKARQLLEYTLTAHTPGMLGDLSIAGISSDGIPDQLLEDTEHRLERRGAKPNRICGYDSLPARILREFKAAGGQLRKSAPGKTGCRVVRVERLSNGVLEVTTEGGKVHRARAGICTFSPGMLDPETGSGDAIFGGLLPQQKRRALEVVKLGPITKFSLEFKERIWIDDEGHWSPHLSVLSNPTGKARTFFSSFPREHNGPHVLTGYLMNQDHKRITKMSDPEAVEHVFQALGKIYGRGRSWKQKDLLVNRSRRRGEFAPSYLRKDWSKDPFALGGNSYLAYHPKSAGKLPAPKAREALKDPRQTLPLFWAGEATAPTYDPEYQPLAVHGAYISGRRVAEDVLNFLGPSNGDANRFKDYYKSRYPLKKPKPRDRVRNGGGPRGGR